MKLEPFLLDQWLEQKSARESPIEFDLASSTGPPWTVRELSQLLPPDEQQRLLDTLLVYSPATGGDELREAIAEMQGVAAEHVQVVTGAAEALLILFFLAAEPGANIILPFPCFPPMAALPQSFGIETRFYHLRREQHFRIDVDEIKSLIDTGTKLLLVNSPHNPTGATLSDEELRALHDFAFERGIQFVCDEVYHPIYHERATDSAAGLPHATVLGDLSKALSLSGLRTGWIVEREPRRMAEYLNARQYFTISNAPLTEALAAAAIRQRRVIWGRAAQVAGANLQLLDQFFAESAEVLSWVRPRGGMTAFPWFNSGADARSCCRDLAARGVLLAPGDCFKMASHFRLGFGAIGSERLAAALGVFADYLSAYPARAAAR